MALIRKRLIAGVLLGLSACGAPEPPKVSAVQPPLETPRPPKEEIKPAQVKEETKPAPPASPPKHPWHFNYCLAANGGSASGCDKAALLLDGNSTNYDGTEGYAATDWSATPPGAMLITLKEATEINTVRFLLWDGDTRYYQYKLEVSPDAEGDQWKQISDCTAGEYRGWQLIPIQPQKIRRFRLTGTFNSANSYFHVVEFQAYYIPAGFMPRWSETSDRPAATNSIGTTKDDF